MIDFTSHLRAISELHYNNLAIYPITQENYTFFSLDGEACLEIVLYPAEKENALLYVIRNQLVGTLYSL